MKLSEAQRTALRLLDGTSILAFEKIEQIDLQAGLDVIRAGLVAISGPAVSQTYRITPAGLAALKTGGGDG